MRLATPHASKMSNASSPAKARRLAAACSGGSGDPDGDGAPDSDSEGCDEDAVEVCDGVDNDCDGLADDLDDSLDTFADGSGAVDVSSLVAGAPGVPVA